ncbi:hypothetical protein EYF80_030450 [Liparis tanakae]|uniref:Uncharacterized protein n=1 Tax=Liparis tanakae TaxID=230148 RepID=A0A4Z2H0G2_9TELE|nr:hypothetical protein EYF80_030450 [Liparis tanakae]
MAMGRKKEKWVERWEKTEEEDEQYRGGDEKKLVEDWRSDNKRNDEDGFVGLVNEDMEVEINSLF